MKRMELNECKTPFEITSWLLEDVNTGTDWQGKRNKYVHFCSKAIQAAYDIGQQSRSLPVVTVGDAATDKMERRTKPRGDVARGLVDAALDGGEPQRIPPRLYAGFPACYLAPVPEVKEID